MYHSQTTMFLFFCIITERAQKYPPKKVKVVKIHSERIIFSVGLAEEKKRNFSGYSDGSNISRILKKNRSIFIKLERRNYTKLSRYGEKSLLSSITLF